MNKYESIISIIACIWLSLCSWQDIKKKRINIILIGSGFLILLIGTMLQGELSIMNRFAGLSLGIILLVLNPITRGQIGVGDGLIVSTTGFCLGFSKNAVLLVYALFGSAVISMVLLVIYRVNRKKSIPFVPFLLIGYLGVLLIG